VSVQGRLAEAKAIGEDIEVLVAHQVDALALVPDDYAEWFDAVTTSLLTPSEWLTFGGTCVVPAESEVEIKAASVSTSNGSDRSTAGRWFFRGRDDGQHDQLLEAAAHYLLVVYRETGSGRELVGAVLVPATIVDELLRDRWYAVDRQHGQVAKLPWTALFDESDLDVAGGDR
jgi:hypothetical protein